MAACMGTMRGILRLHFITNKCGRVLTKKQFHSVVASGLHQHVQPSYSEDSAEYGSPVYPEIKDMSPEGKRRQYRQAWYDSILALPTAEQKLLEISSQLRHEAFLLANTLYKDIPLEFAQFSTRTHVVHHLPEGYESIDVDPLYQTLKPHMLEALKTEILHMPARRARNALLHGFDEDKMLAKSKEEGIIRQLVSLIIRATANDNPHLMNAQMDHDARCEAFWWNGQFHSSKKGRYKKQELMDICFQYLNTACLQIRTEFPLSPVVKRDNPLCTESHIPHHPYYPICYDLPRKKRRLTSIAGHWQADPHDFGFVSFHKQSDVTNFLSGPDKLVTAKDVPNWTDSFGILTSFGWLLALSTYLGFTPYHELTYPLVTQTVLTDGKTWNFFVYQLNTCCLHSDVDTKTYRNVLWSSGDMDLYEAVDDNGQFKGLNDGVLKLLLKFMLNRPAKPEGVELRPYLGQPPPEQEHLEVIRQLHYIFSNRPDPRSYLYHIPMWERIYKRHPKAPLSPLIKLPVREKPDFREQKKRFTSV